MKTIKFFNEQRDIDVEYLVDLIGNSEPIAIYDVTQFVSGVPQWGLNGEAIQFGMFDKNKIDKTVSNKGKTHTPYTVTEFVEFAKGKNLTMVILEDGESAITKNALTAFAWVTKTIEAGVSGHAQLDVLTFPVAAEAQVETIGVPATADAVQGDYVVIPNTAGETLAVWLDIDSNGTVPTGAAFVAANYTQAVAISTGGLAPANAALLAAAIAAETTFAATVTVVDNKDGTIEITQNVLGACDDLAVHNTGDTGVGTITIAVGENDNDGVDGALQGDFIVMTNALTEETAAIWLDIDAAGTVPTGAKYTAADYKIEVNIASGATAATNAAAAVTAIKASDWAEGLTLTDNENGTVDFLQDYTGDIANPDPNNADDSGVGSITTSQTTAGTDGTAYEFELKVEGGVPNLIFTTEDTLPIGLELSTDGVISGTPREIGTFELTITATDHFGNAVVLEKKDLVIAATK